METTQKRWQSEEKLRRLRALFADPAERDSIWIGLLSGAIYGAKERIEVLLGYELPADVYLIEEMVAHWPELLEQSNPSYFSYSTPFLECCIRGEWKAALSLAMMGANLHVKDADGNAAIQYTLQEKVYVYEEIQHYDWYDALIDPGSHRALLLEWFIRRDIHFVPEVATGTVWVDYASCISECRHIAALLMGIQRHRKGYASSLHGMIPVDVMKMIARRVARTHPWDWDRTIMECSVREKKQSI